jgi:hypothetical protein
LAERILGHIREVHQTMSIPSWDDSDDAGDRLGEGIYGRVKAELDPTEFLLWVDRPVSPPPLRVPLVPALFISVLAGLSGFSLAALFGLVGEAWLDLRTLLLALGLGPCVLGGMIFAHLVSLMIRRCLKRRRLSRMVYAVTDLRAIVARIEVSSGELRSCSLRPGEIIDTRTFENPDGSGDLFFIGQGFDQWLPIGFLEVRQVGLVEALVRDALLNSEEDWWKFGTAGAY